MTEYTVGSAGDFATLAQASRAAKPGDVFNLLTGTFLEELDCRVPNVTWQAKPGHSPVIDGGWKKGQVVDGYENTVNITAEGVTVRGVRVINSRGRGYAISASNVTLEECQAYNCYHGGLVANGTAAKGIRNLLIDGCTFERLSQSWITERQPKNVAGSFIFVRVRDSIVRNCGIMDGYGEGLNVDRDSDNCHYYDNVVVSTNHAGCYFNRATNCLVENCIFIHRLEPEYQGASGNWPAAVVFGDETASASFGRQSGNEFSGNVVVSWGRFLEVRNGSNYDTLLTGTTISRNTFISGVETSQGIEIAANKLGPHEGLFVDNVMWFGNARSGAAIGGAAFGIEFYRNAWSELPPIAMRGDGDVYGDLLLVNPGAPVEPFDLDNYRPLPDSPLVLDALDIHLGALAPLDDGEEPPVDPPPVEPEPDEELLAELASMRVSLVNAHHELTAAIVQLDSIVAGLLE